MNAFTECQDCGSDVNPIGEIVCIDCGGWVLAHVEEEG